MKGGRTDKDKCTGGEADTCLSGAAQLTVIDKAVDARDQDREKISSISTRVLPGFMELEPANQIQFERMKTTIESVYRRYGFAPVETPVIERAEVLLAKSGGETQKQMYRFSKGDNDLALRFDLTIPLARYVSEHIHTLSFPFRAYHVGKVFRAEKPQRGRFRELYQCDVDIIGRNEIAIENDAEILSVAYTALAELNIGAFKIKVNNRKILSGLLRTVGEQVDSVAALRAIDKLEKIGAEGVEAELMAGGMSIQGSRQVLDFLRAASAKGSPRDTFRALQKLPINTPAFIQGVEELERVISLAGKFGIPDSVLVMDVSIARGLDYYTGTVYETHMEEAQELGSICSGGRYDNLVGYFSASKLPGVGISIGLTRIFDYLLDIGQVKEPAKSYSIAVILPLGEVHEHAVTLAARLRQEGLSVQVNFERGKFKDKMRYADGIGVPYALIVGEDEIAAGVYTLRDMSSGEQKKLAMDDLISFLKSQDQVQ